MLPSVKNASGAKTKVPSKREEKKRINIRWSSGIFFQVGLALTLLLTFLVMESDWELGSGKNYTPPHEINWIQTPLVAYQLEQPEVKVKPQKMVKQRIIQKPLSHSFTVVDDKTLAAEAKLPPTEVTPDPPSEGKTIAPPAKKTGPENFNSVQFVPVFPGCESLDSNDERRACMSTQIGKFINKKFKTDKFTNLESGRIYNVSVQFTVGKDGNVKDILTRAVLPEMEEEAKRVISKMPVMQPGRQGNTEVDVLFTVPIRFQLQ
jgi:protein TonB